MAHPCLGTAAREESKIVFKELWSGKIFHPLEYTFTELELTKYTHKK